MDKYIENFIKQNPNFPFLCPKCSHKYIFDSKMVFSNDTYEFKCENCDSTVSINTKEFTKTLKKQLNDSGIFIK